MATEPDEMVLGEVRVTGAGGSAKVGPGEYRALALMWIEAVYLQVERFETAVDLFHERLGAQQVVNAWRAGGRSKEWQGEYRKAMRVLRRRQPVTVGPDKYFLLMAVAQLIKCVDALPHDDLPKLSDRELMRDLRNIEEHWDDADGRSIRRVRLAIPDVEPGRIVTNGEHIWIEGVDLMEVLKWAIEVHRQLRLNAQSRGEAVPDEPWRQGLPKSPRAMWMVMSLAADGQE